MDNLFLLRNFLSIVEEGNFTKAAKKLHQSNPSTSRQLSELEAELKQILIVRNTRSLSLTEFGELYYQKSKELIEHYDNLKKLGDLYGDNPRGILKVVGQIYPISNFILPRLAEFCKMYPQMVPDIEISVRPPTMHKENVDVTITMDLLMEHDQSNTLDIVKRYLYDSEVILCCSPDYAKVNAAPKNLEELHNHVYITNSSRLYPDQIRVKNDVFFKLEPSIYVNNTPAMIACAKNNVGIIQVAKEVVLGELANGELIEILKKHSFRKSVYVYYKKIKFVEPKIRRFMDFFFANP